MKKQKLYSQNNREGETLKIFSYKINLKIFFILYIIFLLAVIVISWRIGKNLAIKSQAKEFKKNLEESLALQGKWFATNQTEKGDFVYERNIKTGEKINNYNIVRQAGSLYSLAQLYKKNKDENIKNVLEKGFNFFKNLSQKQDNSCDCKAIIYEGSKKNNTSALLLLALIEYMEKEDKNKEKYLEFATNLANYLYSTQLPSGGFIYEDPRIESDYNNGETFYALIRMYMVTKDEKYLKSVQKAANYFMKKYGQGNINLSFYSWGMAGFSYLYRVDAKEEYWQFMKNSTNSFLENTGRAVDDFFNGKNSIPPKGNLGVFLEGLAHVAWIAKEKDIKYFYNLKLFIEKSLNYILTLQINGPASKITSEFEQIKGGICYDIKCETQRIDIIHHNLSAMYLYLVLVK